MIALRFAHRFAGAAWMLTGGLLAAVAAAAIVAWPGAARWLLAGLPQIDAALAPLMAQDAPLAPALGAFLLIFAAYSALLGAGLLSLRGWARALGISFSLVTGACLAAITALLYLRLTAVAPPADFTPATTAALALSAVTAAASFAFGFVMSAPASLAATQGAPPAPPAPVTARCPTCGGTLDLARARCPKCDADQAHPLEPKRARLAALDGGQEHLVSLRKVNQIGRQAPGLEIRLEHPSVSGHHASLEYHQGRFYLHAQEDTFGTFINQRRSRDAEIRHGDVIGFGQAEYRFLVDY
jgi:hypothetical protein